MADYQGRFINKYQKGSGFVMKTRYIPELNVMGCRKQLRTNFKYSNGFHEQNK